jgi:microcystin-dependent protein
MADPFVAQIQIFPYNFAPTGWALCNGQILSIAQNTALFSLLGTTYGGNGQSNFALPNLQGRMAMQPGQSPGLTDRFLGEEGGVETVTLLTTQIPVHDHQARCFNGDGTEYGPLNSVWAKDTAGGSNEYGPANSGAMAGDALNPSGGNQPHNNLQPYLTLTYCIAMQGIFPPRS